MTVYAVLCIPVKQIRLNGAILRIRLHNKALTLQNCPTLTHHCPKVFVFRIMHDLSEIGHKLLLNRHILNFLYLFLNRHNLNFFLRNYFLVVLRNFLDCVIVLFYHFSGDSLHDFPFLIVDYFSSLGNHFLVGPSFVVDHFLLIGYVLYSALA